MLNALFDGNGKGKYQKINNVEEFLSDNEAEHCFSHDKSSLLKKTNGKPYSKSEEAVALKRNLGLGDGVSVVVGSMIGSGIFIVPTGVLSYCNGDMPTSIVIWVVGGVIAMLIALCFCELGTLIPESGGMAPFLKAIYGNSVCFIFLWIFLLTACPQGAAVQIIALGDYISQAIAVGLGMCSDSLTPNLSKLIGSGIALIILGCNIVSVKLAVKVQFWCTAGKVAALIIIAVAGIFVIITDSSTLSDNFRRTAKIYAAANNVTDESIKNVISASLDTFPGLGKLSLAVFQAMWAYDGFDNITLITEEVKNPKKTLPMIIIVSLLTVISLYLVVNLSYFAVLTEQEMIDSDAVAVSFAAKVHPWLAYVVTAGVCLSLIGSINITFLAAGRMPFVAGRMGFMPEILSMIHIHYFSPVPALLFLSTLIAVMVLPSNINMLLKGVVFTLWIARALCALGIFILRRKLKFAKRPYKVYKITAFLATSIGAYIVFVPLFFDPQVLYVLTLVLVLLFGFVYWLMMRKVLVISGIGSVSVFFQKLLQVASSSTNHSKAN